MSPRQVYLTIPPAPDRKRAAISAPFDLVGRTSWSPRRVSRRWGEPMVTLTEGDEQVDGCVMIATSARIPVVFLDRFLGSVIAVQAGMDVEAAMDIAKAAVDGKLIRLR